MNQLYDYGREGFLAGDIAWDSDDIRVALLSSAYSFSAAHQHLDEITGIVATSGALTGKTTTNGVADADDVTFSAVTGAQITQFIIYQHTGTAATSRLIAFFDSATNLPLTPNGGDVTIQWSAEDERVFKL